MEEDSLVALVENTARARKDVPIPREYFLEALKMINNGERKVETYPTGLPSLTGLYQVALELYEADQKKP